MPETTNAAFRPIGPAALLSPVPAVLLSCRGERGDSPANLITIAWAGTVCSEPPMVSVSIRPERYSHALIEKSGCFCLNLVSRKLCRATDFCGVRSGRDVDKFRSLGLHPWTPEGVDAPALEEAPAFLTCRVRRILPLGSHDLFLSEIENVYVKPDLLDEKGALHLERADLVSYAHGRYYGLTREALGFFGYSVARPDVLSRRLAKDGLHKKERRK